MISSCVLCIQQATKFEKKYLSQNHKQNDEDKGEIKVSIFAEYVILFLRDTKDRTR